MFVPAQGRLFAGLNARSAVTVSLRESLHLHQMISVILLAALSLFWAKFQILRSLVLMASSRKQSTNHLQFTSLSSSYSILFDIYCCNISAWLQSSYFANIRCNNHYRSNPILSVEYFVLVLYLNVETTLHPPRYTSMKSLLQSTSRQSPQAS